MKGGPLPHYFPPFLWKFWFSSDGDGLDAQYMHIYDVHGDELAETRRVPDTGRSIFHDFDNGVLDPGCRAALQKAEVAFGLLEYQVEGLLRDVMEKITAGHDCLDRRPIDMAPGSVTTLSRYFAFLRYRNSTHYYDTLQKLGLMTRWWSGHLGPYTPFQRMRRRAILASFKAFLALEPGDVPIRDGFYEEVLYKHWSQQKQVDLNLGIASEGSEYLLSDACFVALDEEDDPDAGSCYLFPLSANVGLYLDAYPPNWSGTFQKLQDSTVTTIDCDYESATDVHMRNTILLRSNPSQIYFRSLTSIVKSLTWSHDFEATPGQWDYTRLKARCRDRSIREAVKQTLTLRGTVAVTDLTEDVVRIGDSPVCHGSFADIWKGTWTDRVDKSTRIVAMKVLRSVMVQNVKEKLLSRLKDEILAWHRLSHPHILQFHGVVQMSSTLGMVSAWCDNGTIVHYLDEVNPTADRLDLLCQIASGVSYLHNFKPVVIHGDLKGSNILVNQLGQAVITDFGLSKVMEDFGDSTHILTSFFAGSTRWMAPELILALVQDDGDGPQLTTHSDVYAFASVASGQLPFPHRTNDHAVTVDIMRGVKPSRGSRCLVACLDHDSFWSIVERCWNSSPRLRASMTEVTESLRCLKKAPS
ncbi:kinase-like protein [Neolentinus lepideus HHB14362 ss-1]|uniref:Kinase-like protein n=1 Tax=Neolentinus lepideus HHB14362 ss-1 TaxID=1314782 RepID=A0A165MC38_9AGAM|nr:kinase-like protein [Neolentinus lepideus HHB14362 ss-1]